MNRNSIDDQWITNEIEYELMHDKKKRSRFLIPMLLAIIILAALLGLVMYSNSQSEDMSTYINREIVIKGLEEEDFTVTPASLMELPCVEVYTNGGTRKSAGVNGYGPELTTLLAEHGRTIDEFQKIRFLCADDYKVVLKRQYLEDDYQMVLAVKQLNKRLPKAQQPLRLIIPEGESGKWAYGILEIEFIEKDPKP